MGESHGGQKQKFLPFIGSGNEKLSGFGESDGPTMDEMKGRFAQILPPKAPNDQLREVAKAMLKVKGVAPAMRGTAPDALTSLTSSSISFSVQTSTSALQLRAKPQNRS